VSSAFRLVSSGQTSLLKAAPVNTGEQRIAVTTSRFIFVRTAARLSTTSLSNRQTLSQCRSERSQILRFRYQAAPSGNPDGILGLKYQRIVNTLTDSYQEHLPHNSAMDSDTVRSALRAPQGARHRER
jgi:hypothetical protein